MVDLVVNYTPWGFCFGFISWFLGRLKLDYIMSLIAI